MLEASDIPRSVRGPVGLYTLEVPGFTHRTFRGFRGKATFVDGKAAPVGGLLLMRLVKTLKHRGVKVTPYDDETKRAVVEFVEKRGNDKRAEELRALLTSAPTKLTQIKALVHHTDLPALTAAQVDAIAGDGASAAFEAQAGKVTLVPGDIAADTALPDDIEALRAIFEQETGGAANRKWGVAKLKQIILEEREARAPEAKPSA